MLKLYNSLTRQIQEFQSIKPKKVGLYTCGPTVYNYAHIGNLRTYTFEDILRRVLIYNGYKVKHVMNTTDVGHLSGDQDFAEDKMEKKGGSRDEIMRLAKTYTKAFMADLKNLNILKADILTPATKHIPEQIELIKILFKKGFAYETDLAIYFDVNKFPDYGQLTGQKMEDKKIGARSDVVVDPNKKHPADFALWFKLAGKYKNHILKWDSPWGWGFPGWHIECSAMSQKYLGQPFDIHTGGVDNLFPHHTNEIAQSTGAFNLPLANYWLHGEHILINEGKMAKSEGNFITLQNLIDKKINPLSYRYLILTSHYRSKLNFTREGLQGAQNALNNLYTEISCLKLTKIADQKYLDSFLSALNNDLNSPQALAVAWNLLKSNNVNKLTTLFKFDEVLGLNLKNTWKQAQKNIRTIKKLVANYSKARQQKNFTLSDVLRKQINEKGFILEDFANGTVIKKKY